MKLEGVKICIALTGSHCTLDKVLPQIKKMRLEGGKVAAIISPAIDNTDTRFGESTTWKKKIVQLTGEKILNTITGAEPIGPKSLFDIVVIAPCTGNTMAKLANAITDTAVLMAAKAQLRNRKPLLLGISTNDALGINAKNLAVLLNTKDIFFIPFRQDSPYQKPNSVVAAMDLMLPAVEAALENRQLQPVLLGYKENDFKIS